MMHIGKCTFWLASLSCLSSLVLAGPVEDYEAGAKSFYAGNIVEALPPLKLAADKGHAAAQVLLADILDSSEFDEDAVAYYLKAANQGNADGQYGLATMYAKGEGVARDFSKTRQLATQAAAQDHKSAIIMLAQAHLRGGLGLDEATRQGPQALSWIKRAADIDYLPALIALSTAYRTGQYGLTIDPKMVETLDARTQKVREQINAASLPKK